MKLSAWLVIAVMVAAQAVRSADQSSVSEAASRDLTAGIDAMRAGKVVEARIDLERSVRENPNNGEAQLQLGLLLGQLADIQGARDAFQRAVKAQPDCAEAHYNLGLTEIADATGKRDWVAASREFREAVRLRPQYVQAHRMLGVGLEQSGQRDASIVEFRAALAVDPNSIETRIELGKAYEGNGDLASAEREYRAAVQLRPGFEGGEIALGKLLLEREGQDSEAAERFRNALRTNPDVAAAQYSLAKVLQRSGHATQAALAFRQAAALTKQQEDAVQCTRLSNQGLDAARNGQVETSVDDLRQAVKLRPDSAIAHYNLGLVLADQGDLVAARAQIVEAISLMPADSRFYIALGRMWKKAGDRQRWLAAMEKGAGLDPENKLIREELRDAGPAPERTARKDDPFQYGAATNTPEAHFAFAEILAQQGDWIGAAGEWLRVLALRPNDVEARNNLGVSYAHAAKDDKAELEFRKALQVQPDSPGAHFGLAILDLQRGSKSDAVEELRQVVRVRPDYPQAQYLLSRTTK